MKVTKPANKKPPKPPIHPNTNLKAEKPPTLLPESPLVDIKDASPSISPKNSPSYFKRSKSGKKDSSP